MSEVTLGGRGRRGSELKPREPLNFNGETFLISDVRLETPSFSGGAKGKGVGSCKRSGLEVELKNNIE